ncbi:MAG: alanine--tRNA ligase [Patescibacteria group bacterium]
MTAKELKHKYLDFFQNRDHAVIPGSSLLPENDPTVLFTTAGMHPLVPYLLGEKHPAGKRLADIQKCIRTGDIDEVGDDWHLTFFEMLGNWSLGEYFKEEAIKMSFEFLTKELNIPLEKLAFTCFEGEGNIPKDEESARIWQLLGVKEERIAFLGKKDNWWGPAGKTGPCGPDTEIFFWVGEETPPPSFDPSNKNWVEIWNDVFMQYNKNNEGEYVELAQKNVDTGMGLERTVAVLDNKKSVYEIEPLSTIVSQVAALFDVSFEDLEKEQIKAVRIISDHLRAAVFILSEKVVPANVEQGYVLRRLIRRAVRYGRSLGIPEMFTGKIAEVVIAEMGGFYKELRTNRDFIMDELAKEEEKFSSTLEKGLKEFEKIKTGKITAPEAFKLFATYGFPFEMTKELAKERKLEIDEEGFWQEFGKHQEISRQGAEKKFKGGLADDSETTAKMHTATHLMLSALRKVLGGHVFQKGANITSERIRFDFSHPEKVTPEQLKQVEDLVNAEIEKKIPIVCEEMGLEEAKEKGAMGVFENKYGEKVKVYAMGEFSKEICGGPHASNTGDLGRFRIVKEESSSSGVRRIKAVLE